MRPARNRATDLLWRSTGALAFLTSLLASAVAHAEDAAPAVVDSGDTAWVITASRSS